MATNGHTYGDVERALLAAFGIAEDGTLAFRARLQHLRRNGVPDVPAPGKGKRVVFDDRHVDQLLLALELEAAGFPPSLTPKIVPAIMNTIQWRIGVTAGIHSTGGAEYWLALSVDHFRPTYKIFGVTAESAIADKLKEWQADGDRILLLNLSRRGRAVTAALRGSGR